MSQRHRTNFNRPVILANADHAGNPDNGHPTGGYALLIAGGAVSWSSRLQTITALSTTEAEYVAAVDAGKDVVWMCQLLGELGFTLSAPSVLCMDNQSAISVAKNLLKFALCLWLISMVTGCCPFLSPDLV